MAWRYVETDVTYAGLVPAEVDGPLAERPTFMQTKRYHYVLELDGTGRIIGGEWAGPSVRDHPDFVWVPLAVRPRTEPISTERVLQLHELSLQ